jgi:hypothetical protein
MFELPTWGWLRRDIKSQREAVDRWLKSGVGEGGFFFCVYFLLIRSLRLLFLTRIAYLNSLVRISRLLELVTRFNAHSTGRGCTCIIMEKSRINSA